MKKENFNAHPTPLNIGSGSYELDQPSPAPDERYILAHPRDDTWCVYYAEKGDRSVLREFHSKAEACLYLLHLLAKEEKQHAA